MYAREEWQTSAGGQAGMGRQAGRQAVSHINNPGLVSDSRIVIDETEPISRLLLPTAEPVLCGTMYLARVQCSGGTACLLLCGAGGAVRTLILHYQYRTSVLHSFTSARSRRIVTP